MPKSSESKVSEVRAYLRCIQLNLVKTQGKRKRSAAPAAKVQTRKDASDDDGSEENVDEDDSSSYSTDEAESTKRLSKDEISSEMKDHFDAFGQLCFLLSRGSCGLLQNLVVPAIKRKIPDVTASLVKLESKRLQQIQRTRTSRLNYIIRNVPENLFVNPPTGNLPEPHSQFKPVDAIRSALKILGAEFSSNDDLVNCCTTPIWPSSRQVTDFIIRRGPVLTGNEPIYPKLCVVIAVARYVMMIKLEGKKQWLSSALDFVTRDDESVLSQLSDPDIICSKATFNADRKSRTYSAIPVNSAAMEVKPAQWKAN